VVDHQDGHAPVFAICYFTPRQQIGLCGYAAVATFTALVEEGRCKLQDESTRVLQRTWAGELLIDLSSAEDSGVMVEMDQWLPSFETSSLETLPVGRALGDLRQDSRLSLEIAPTGRRHLPVPYARVDDLPHLSPNYTGRAGMSHALRVNTVCAFAVSPEGATHVRLRDFCSGIGVNEERASGTTSGAQASYLIRQGVPLAESSGEVLVRVAQGLETGPRSRIEAKLLLVEAKVGSVSVRGKAARVLAGCILPASLRAKETL